MNADKSSVLIADDEKTNIIALTHILSPDYTVYAANNGLYAINLAKKHLPDVILLDILMPEMDGYEVLSQLKTDEATREIPVIFVTGLGKNEEEEKGFKLGAADYITKPFNPTIVKLRVRNLLNMLNLANEKKAAITRIRETDEYTQLLIDASPISCTLWNKDLTIINCNIEALKLFGVKNREEFNEKFYKLSPEYQPTGEKSTENANAKIRKVFETGFLRTEWMHQTLSGEPLPCEVILTRVKHRDQHLVAGYTRDLRELKAHLDKIEKTQENLRIAKDAAEAANKSKSSFLANMSHEIRTPMNAILGITEILLQIDSLAPNIKESINRIYNSGDLLLGIINDILDLSKIEAGKLELTLSKYEVLSMLNDTLTLNLMRIGSKEIEFKLLVDENLPLIMFGDVLRIKQILNNLLSNSFKYTEKGAITLSITAEPISFNESTLPGNLSTAAKETEVMIVFSVVDTGQGMTEEQVSKLFNQYTRFNTEVEGTGLGLTITKNLILLMKGDISVKSEVNKGTVFTVRIPQKKISSKIIGKKSAEKLQNFNLNGNMQIKRSHITYIPMPYGSVLIVDDVESNLYVAKGIMSPYGLKIETATSGFEAIDKIKSGKIYDIIFMDHMMPLMDGIEVTKNIRCLGYKRPIVALTANAVVGQSDIFLANGFDDFISKPIDVRNLDTVLKKYIREKQPEEAAKAEAAQNNNKAEQTACTDGSFEIDTELLDIFLRDSQKAIITLENMHEYDDETIKLYTVTVHGMKSSLAFLGESQLSAFAANLEKASRNKNIEVISADTPAFINELRTTANKFTQKT